MTTTDSPIQAEGQKYLGRTVFDADHERVGEIDGIYYDDATGSLAWISFTTDFLWERDAFVPAAQITPFSDGVSIPLDRPTLQNMPKIRPLDGSLSGAQVARLHEFFGTFDGRQRVTSAHQGAPLVSAPNDVPDPSTLFRGRVHETAFGTGRPGPNEPHDVTLQGTGNAAP